VIALLERLVPLWTQPVDARDAPEAAFRAVYADPVVVNGTEMTITELADRARSLQRAFDRLDMQILDTVENACRCQLRDLGRLRRSRPAAPARCGQAGLTAGLSRAEAAVKDHHRRVHPGTA